MKRRMKKYNPEQLDILENSRLLTRREKQVLNLRYRDGLSYVDISIELEPEVSVRTIGNILKSIHIKAEEILSAC